MKKNTSWFILSAFLMGCIDLDSEGLKPKTLPTLQYKVKDRHTKESLTNNLYKKIPESIYKYNGDPEKPIITNAF